MRPISDDDPISDDEVLYRRIPESQGWYDALQEVPLARDAFLPSHRDTTGLSLYRAKFIGSQECAALGTHGKRYFVARISASKLSSLGVTVLARPVPEVPGHAEIPLLCYQDRRSDQVLETAQRVADAIGNDVLGPFDGKKLRNQSG